MKLSPCLALVATLMAMSACTTDSGSRYAYDVLRNTQEQRCNQAATWEESQACKAKLAPQDYDSYRRAKDEKVR